MKSMHKTAREDPEWVHCLAPIYPAVGIGKVKLEMTRAAFLLLLVTLRSIMIASKANQQLERARTGAVGLSAA
jgi:hypothetical protein